VFLIDNRDGQRWLNDSGLAEIATFATGIGPAKACWTVIPRSCEPRTPEPHGHAVHVHDAVSRWCRTLHVDRR
jgi:hypothetical protein